MSSPWQRLVGRRPIVTRLVLAVALTMALVLLLTSGFLFWRVAFALDRQLNQDLDAYQETVEADVARGDTPPRDTPGQSYQVYDVHGRLLASDAEVDRLVSVATVEGVVAGDDEAEDRHGVGHLLAPTAHPYRVVTQQVSTPRGPVVVATAISKRKHDEALRELLLQLFIADLATLLAASVVGYRTARAALRPVEQYRQAAASATDGDPDTSPATRAHVVRLLPVADDRDDEITRLGHTFNGLLRRLAQANERERRFLADASHELRTPLALMRAEIEVALSTPQDAAQTDETFRSLSEQVERLVSVCTAILDLEELRSGEETAVETIDVPGLLRDVADRFREVAEGSGRRVTVQPPPGGDDGPVLPGHRHWLELAVTNLVSNALRYGAGTVSLSASSAPGWVRITVSDEGEGFPDEFVDRAFDRFTRADTARSTRGTGLGLSLVQAAAEAHGGSAAILPTSQGVGVRVVLELPHGSAD